MSSDPLYLTRNKFHLGQFPQVINEITSEHGLQGRILKLRSFISLRQYGQVIQDVQPMDPTSLQAIKVLAQYLEATKNRADEAGRQKAVKSVEKLQTGDPVTAFFAASVLLHEGNFGLAIQHLKGFPKDFDWYAFL